MSLRKWREPKCHTDPMHLTQTYGSSYLDLRPYTSITSPLLAQGGHSLRSDLKTPVPVVLVPTADC